MQPDAGFIPDFQPDVYSREFRPSQYTAMLLQEVEAHASVVQQRHVLDVGVGSGVLLAAAARLGASALSGVDISQDALDTTQRLLKVCADNIPCKLHLGDMWQPIPDGVRYSMILANLPHFPGAFHDKERPSTWAGGDGRGIINRFILGLPHYLAEGGVALMTHHDLIDFQHTQRLIQELGLSFETQCQWTVFEPPERMMAVSRQTYAQGGESVRCYGGYAFMNARIIKIYR